MIRLIRVAASVAVIACSISTPAFAAKPKPPPVGFGGKHAFHRVVIAARGSFAGKLDRANDKSGADASCVTPAIRSQKVSPADLPSDECLGLADQPAQAITSAEVKGEAARLIPSAAIGLAPHGTTLVNIQTIMWVDAPKTRALPAVQILGQQVSITITLDHVDWSFGDGQRATESGPGSAYDEANHPCRTRLCPGYFGHVYLDRGPVHVKAIASWQASFRVGGGPVVPIPGTIAGPTATSDLAVKEARGVLIPNPGDR